MAYRNNYILYNGEVGHYSSRFGFTPIAVGSIYCDRSKRTKNGPQRNDWRAEIAFGSVRIRRRSSSRKALELWLWQVRKLWLSEFISGNRDLNQRNLEERLRQIKAAKFWDTSG